MSISHAELVTEAERRGMTGRTRNQVKADLANAKRNGADIALASLMLRFGRLQPDARNYVEDYLKP